MNLFKSKKRKWILVIGALLYVVLPIDFLPDLLPYAGILDDIAVILAVIYKLYKDSGAGSILEKNTKVVQDQKKKNDKDKVNKGNVIDGELVD